MRKITTIIALFCALSMNAQYGNYFSSMRNPASYSVEEKMIAQGWEYYGSVHGYFLGGTTDNPKLENYFSRLTLYYKELGQNVVLRIYSDMERGGVYAVSKNPYFGNMNSLLGRFEYYFFSDMIREWVFFNIE